MASSDLQVRKATYAIEPMGPAGAKMTITYTPKIFAVIIFHADGTSKVDTTHIPPRYLTPDVVKAEQKKYAALIIVDQPRNAFRSLQKHFDARKLKRALRPDLREKEGIALPEGRFWFKVQSSKFKVEG